jgi:hypothetical protein
VNDGAGHYDHAGLVKLESDRTDQLTVLLSHEGEIGQRRVGLIGFDRQLG